MNCQSCQSKISAYLDQEMTGQQMMAMREHLNGCRECSKELEEIKQMTSVLLRSPECAEPPEWLNERIMSAVDEAAQQKPKRAASALILTASAAAAFFMAYIVASVFTPLQESPQTAHQPAKGFDLSADQAYQISSDPFSSHVPVALPAGHSQP